MKLNSAISNHIDITTEVLEGDALIQLLFSLFIRGLKEIYVNQETDVILLSYADDLVILATSPVDCKKKLNALEKYRFINNLSVHISKTKLVSLKKGKNKKINKICFEVNELEITNNIHFK